MKFSNSLSKSHSPLLCLQLLFFLQVLQWYKMKMLLPKKSNNSIPASPRLIETITSWVYILDHGPQCHFCEFDSPSNEVNRKFNTNMSKAELNKESWISFIWPRSLRGDLSTAWSSLWEPPEFTYLSVLCSKTERTEFPVEILEQLNKHNKHGEVKLQDWV